MDYRTFTETLERIRVVPVITVDDAPQALSLADSLIAGGLPLMEITFRSDAASAAIEAVRAQKPEVIVGAGTVLTVDQLDSALAAGAQFIVAPGFNPRVVDAARERGVPFAPGVATPSEIEWALEKGLTHLKFFPAEQSGGIAYLKSVSGPYRGVKFMPTGGISIKNLKEYLSLPSVAACGGSWMVKIDMIRAGEFDRIAELAREAVAVASSQ